MRTLYLIDGIAVTRRVYEKRQLFGEHAGARFSTVDVRIKIKERFKGYR